MPNKKVAASELRTGDVLMSLGDAGYSRLIAELEEGKYSHASFFSRGGGNQVDCIIHATTMGVRREPLSVLGSSGYEYVDAYRPKICPDPPKSLERAAAELIGKPYDFPSLVMVAFVIWCQCRRGLPRIYGVVKEFAKEHAEGEGGPSSSLGVFGFLTKGITALFESRPKDKLMTCTEVVTTAFWNADPETRRFALQFKIPNLRWRRWGDRLTIAGPGTLQDDPQDVEEFYALLEACNAQFDPALKPGPVLHLTERVTAGRELPLNMVSPRDMQDSPSLNCLGRLYP